MEIDRNIQPEFKDDRGAITKVLDKDFAIRSVLHITSKKGSIRSNHYHKTDSHYCYLVSGKAEYYEKPVEGGKLEKTALNAGDMVYSAPMIIHAFKFLEDTVMYAYAAKSRNQADYEADTVRVALITA